MKSSTLSKNALTSTLFVLLLSITWATVIQSSGADPVTATSTDNLRTCEYKTAGREYDDEYEASLVHI